MLKFWDGKLRQLQIIYISRLYQRAITIVVWVDAFLTQDDIGEMEMESFVSRFRLALQQLHHDECPHVPNPPNCKRRASVAVVLRIRPSFSRNCSENDSEILRSPGQTYQQSFDHFFQQSWVQQGDPEVLLIKRAARHGDRWTGHVALPGGKRDPGDSDDRATSARETWEETGMDINAAHCLYVGNLPERVIKTAWDNIP